MGDIAKIFVTGLVAMGLVVAFSTHASSLGTLVSKTGTAGQGLEYTAETGNA